MEFEYLRPVYVYPRLSDVNELEERLSLLSGWQFETDREGEGMRIVLHNRNPLTGDEVTDADPFIKLSDLLLHYEMELKDRRKMIYLPKEICSCADESRQAAQPYYETPGDARQQPEPRELHGINGSHHGRAQIFSPSCISDQFENCQAAINRGDPKGAASILLAIGGHSLLKAHQKSFSELVGIQNQSRRMATETDAINVWEKFKECCLDLGQYTLEALDQGTYLAFDSKESLYDWLHELVAHIVDISESLRYLGYVDCEQRISQDEIISCYEECFEVLKMGTTSIGGPMKEPELR
ncbi:hypothetical protein BDV37DRAFT_289596 [Aspergillus pseudonomiae]|uniref:Uncharacterized protein n=1 Tax=Aspergillus pseudonomiae TaxID=1506151 RepID=A0A5N7CSR5_9EURO|nr:uncharacterized protein BDV37DRAFT_289596 [Aspergillus pseudonomiae]KAE8397236.1 hypothetical protein BDV37DRAFT_289596 [Aspergillus pseudonomiae]